MQKGKIHKIYISGAMTHAKEDMRGVFEAIGNLAKEVCGNVYVPHLYSDPIEHKNLTPFEVWKKDHFEVASSDLIIAYVGEPSLGTGGELEIARVTHSEIILWWLQGQKVSRMARGNPFAKIQIEAKDEHDLYKQMKRALNKYIHE